MEGENWLIYIVPWPTHTPIHELAQIYKGVQRKPSKKQKSWDILKTAHSFPLPIEPPSEEVFKTKHVRMQTLASIWLITKL